MKYKRHEIEALIRSHGGDTTDTVSKKTNYLVCGEEPGSKLDKARTLGVPVVSEADFEKMIRKV